MHDLADKIAALRESVGLAIKSSTILPDEEGNATQLAIQIDKTLKHLNTALPIIDAQAAQIAALVAERDAAVAERDRLREALRACRRATLHGAPEPRHNVREIVDAALTNGGSNG